MFASWLLSLASASQCARALAPVRTLLDDDARLSRFRKEAVAARLKLILRATSLGGTHSLIEHRASIEGALTRSPESLLRLSVGLEGAEDLIADLDQALRG